MIAGLLLVAAVWAAYETHVRWERADQRQVELAAPEEIWAELAELQEAVRSLDEQIRPQMTRLRMN